MQINNQHLIGLINDRRAQIDIREAAAKTVENLNTQIMDVLTMGGVTKRHQLPDGRIIQIVQPKDRETVIPELLLGQGVAPKIIERATERTPVRAFIRVDAAKAAETAAPPVVAANDAPADVAVDAPDTPADSDQPPVN